MPVDRREAIERRRREVAQRVTRLERDLAISNADASSLAALSLARTELAEMERALRGVEASEDHDPNVVELGDTVTIKEEGSRETERYTIVGPVEARVDESWISSDSPLGTALLGRAVGDRITVDAPAGSIRCTILLIER